MDFDELRARAAAAGPYVRDPDNHSMKEATRILTEECQVSVTHAAQVFAAARRGPLGLDELIAAVRAELALEMYHGLRHPDDLIFHTMDWNGELNIIVTPSRGRITVDVAGEPLTLTPDVGPVAGMSLRVPQPFTEPEEKTNDE